MQLCLLESVLQPGHIQYAQGDASPFENILIAAAAFMQLALSAAHVEQGDERQHGKRQAQQAFTNKCRQQFFKHALAIEQPAQLPVAAA
ncbi:hypothetical protein D3C76_1501690 [compost metagenome]